MAGIRKRTETHEIRTHLSAISERVQQIATQPLKF